MTKMREAAQTVAFIDAYCAQYRSLFTNVRHFEQFTALQLGLLAETKRKSLPRLAKTAKADAQALHHFLANAERSVEELRAWRLDLLRHALGGRAFILCIDETGDRKKGRTTDYVAHQYIGNIGGLANGVVSVNAYGVLDGTPFPLAFRVYKPKARLKPGDVFKSKPQLAIELIHELQALGFHFSVVLADSMYGESGDFTAALDRLGLPYVVAIRSNHAVWTAPDERKRYNRWRMFDRLFADGTSEPRFIREVVFGRRRPWRLRYFQITTDPARQPVETTWYIASNLPGKIEQTVGDVYGWRTWIEYGFKQVKDELGWADYRVTDYHATRALVGVGHECGDPRSATESSARLRLAGVASVSAPARSCPSAVGSWPRLEAHPQQPAALPAALHVRVPLTPLAASAPPPTLASGLG